MKGVEITSAGGPEVLQLKDVQDVEAKPGEVVVKVAAAGLNYADVMQREGNYPPPPGSSLLPGLEVSGIIEKLGDGVQGWKVGDEVCALLTGGGYAERVTVPAVQLMRIPRGISLEDAASLPEVICTVVNAVFLKSNLKAGQSFLVHGGTSGIGTMAIQLCKLRGAKVMCTVGNAEKADICRKLGADVIINYKTEDFVDRVKQETDGKGVDVVLDIMGAPYLMRNLSSLAYDGKLYVLGLQGGTQTEVNLGLMLMRRLTIISGGLRSQPPEYKGKVCQQVQEEVWPLIESGKVNPMIHEKFPLAKVVEAHHALAADHIGKILLTMSA